MAKFLEEVVMIRRYVKKIVREVFHIQMLEQRVRDADKALDVERAALLPKFNNVCSVCGDKSKMTSFPHYPYERGSNGAKVSYIVHTCPCGYTWDTLTTVGGQKMKWLENVIHLRDNYDKHDEDYNAIDYMDKWLMLCVDDLDRLIAIAEIGGRDCGCPYGWHNHLNTCPHSDDWVKS